MTSMTNPLLPDELDKLHYPQGLDPVSVRANYLNRRQIDRHQALLGRVGNRVEALSEIAKGKKTP